MACVVTIIGTDANNLLTDHFPDPARFEQLLEAELGAYFAEPFGKCPGCAFTIAIKFSNGTREPDGVPEIAQGVPFEEIYVISFADGGGQTANDNARSWLDYRAKTVLGKPGWLHDTTNKFIYAINQV